MKKGVLIAVAVGIAAALGFFAQRRMQTAPAMPAAVQNEPAAASNVVPVTTGTTNPPAADAAADAGADAATVAAAAAPKIPESLPHFELADRDNKKQSLKNWAGRPVMVNFWATWCGPCRREIPLLNKLRKQHSAQRVEVIGIAVDFRDDVLQYAKENPIQYPLLIGEEDGLAAVTAMGMQPAFPFTVFADSKQRVVALKVGELHEDDAELIIEKLLAVDSGKLELAAAREQITEGLKELATRRAKTKEKSPAA